MMSELRLRGEDLYWRAVDGTVIALEARASTYLSANPAGALLWSALEGGATRDALAGELVSAYGIEREAALADTDAFLGELDEHGLLVR
jgi:hypothetical protein